MNIIFAIDSKNGYAKDGSIPWKNKDDMKHFRDKTLNNIIIMGRKTWESIGSKPLKNRINVVITSNLYIESSEYRFSSLKEAIDFFSDYDKKIFIIGGKSLIVETINNYINLTIYVTRIRGDYNCDQFIDDSIFNNFRIRGVENLDNCEIYMLNSPIIR